VGRRSNGEGTIYRRKDGRFEAAMYVPTTSGQSRRIRIYGKTRAEAHRKLTEAAAGVQAGVPVPGQTARLAEYLDYWLEHHVKPSLRPKTYELYEVAVRLYLKPGLGRQTVRGLSVPMVQAYLNEKLAEGHSVRKVQIIRTTLSAALTRAQREELVSRNVARLVELPQWERAEIQPWSAEEAWTFLEAAAGHPLYSAFLLLVLCGLRRGEALGLRWCDINLEENRLYIRQQLQRIGPSLTIGPVKTRSGQRDLPLVETLREALFGHRQRQLAGREACGSDWAGSGDGDELVFTTVRGTPIEPRNFVRSFWRICQANNIRVIKLHHIRHTAATLLKDLGVQARDVQFILGHASSWTTEQVYQHDDMASREAAISRIEALLCKPSASGGSSNCRQVPSRCRQFSRHDTRIMDKFASVISGGPSGARTQDTLLKRQFGDSLTDRFQEVEQVARAAMRQWFVGIVAVNLAVKT
jgi:integrase